jgi:hypothetical protein
MQKDRQTNGQSQNGSDRGRIALRTRHRDIRRRRRRRRRSKLKAIDVTETETSGLWGKRGAQDSEERRKALGGTDGRKTPEGRKEGIQGSRQAG